MDIEYLKEFVKSRHGNQLRKQGTMYYLHPYAVCDILNNMGYNINYQVTGLFHDLLEDTNTTYKEILEISNINVANAVGLLTKENGYNMEEYMFRINNNEIARIVKIADRIHNLEESVFASIEFRKKYIKETKKYFINLAKDTVFEERLNEVLLIVEKSIL